MSCPWWPGCRCCWSKWGIQGRKRCSRERLGSWGTGNIWQTSRYANLWLVVKAGNLALGVKNQGLRCWKEKCWRWTLFSISRADNREGGEGLDPGTEIKKNVSRIRKTGLEVEGGTISSGGPLTRCRLFRKVEPGKHSFGLRAVGRCWAWRSCRELAGGRDWPPASLSPADCTQVLCCPGLSS